MTYQDLWRRLTPQYEPHEAQAIVRTLLDGLFDMSLTDIVSGKVNELSAENQQLLEEKMQKLEEGVPVQYAVGYEWFDGRRFAVSPSVLIPRPETAELCKRVRHDYCYKFCALQPPEPLRILDIGTGSGCIAITLALDIPYAVVDAWDVSPDALLVARKNAHTLQAEVNLQLHDVLDTESLPVPADKEKYDVIVSNPPYICDKERETMDRNVLDYEPEKALFVPDDAPLLFYRAIAGYARRAMKKDGRLYFEVNALYARDVAAMLDKSGFYAVVVKNDQFGKPRFVIARLSK